MATQRGDMTDRSGALFQIQELATRHRLLSNLIIHNLLFALALLAAYLIRFDAGLPGHKGGWFYSQYLLFLPYIMLTKSLIFARKKLFRDWWQYAGIRDVAIFNYAFPVILDKDDYMLIQVANQSGTANITAEEDSDWFLEER